MTEWSPDDLAALAAADEVDISPEGAPVAPVTIWIVSADGELFVRAYRGPYTQWWRAALASGRGVLAGAGLEVDVVLEPADPDVAGLVDEAYLQKYGDTPYAGSMLADPIRETTLRVRPAP